MTSTYTRNKDRSVSVSRCYTMPEKVIAAALSSMLVIAAVGTFASYVKLNVMYERDLQLTRRVDGVEVRADDNRIRIATLEARGQVDR